MTLYKTSHSFTFKPPPWCLYFQSHLYIPVEGLFSFCFGNLGAAEAPYKRAASFGHASFPDPWRVVQIYTCVPSDLFWQTLNSSTPLCRSGKGPLQRQAHVLAGSSLTSALSFGLHALMSSDSVCENKPWAHPPLQQRRRLRSGVCSLRHSPDGSSCHKGSINLRVF